jgi:hypothetical protein
MTYDVKSAWVLTVFKFFHLVVIFIFEDKILMYITLNTAKFAECSLNPLVISFCCFPLAICASQAGSLCRLCITSGFPLAACVTQAGSH